MFLRPLLVGFLFFLLAPVHAQGQEMKELSAKLMALMDKQDLGKAIKVLDRMIALRPDSANLYTKKATCLCRSGKAQESFPFYNRALELDPQNVLALVDRGTCFLENGHPEKAEQDYTEGMALTTNDTLLALCYMNRAAARRSYRDFKGDLEDNLKALEYEPDNIGVHNNIGMTYAEKKEYDKAEFHLRKVLALDSTFPGGLMNLGFLYSELERFKEALDIFDVACSKFPNEPYVFNNRGFVKHQLGDSKGGIKDIEQSLKMLPTNSYAYRNLAIIYSDLGEREKSCTMANTAINQGFTTLYGEEMRKFYLKNCTK